MSSEKVSRLRITQRDPDRADGVARNLRFEVDGHEITSAVSGFTLTLPDDQGLVRATLQLNPMALDVNLAVVDEPTCSICKRTLGAVAAIAEQACADAEG